jgi:hypothetical protein
MPMDKADMNTCRSWARHDAAGELAQRRVWRRQANASNVVMSGVGHLVSAL